MDEISGRSYGRRSQHERIITWISLKSAKKYESIGSLELKQVILPINLIISQKNTVTSENPSLINPTENTLIGARTLNIIMLRAL